MGWPITITSTAERQSQPRPLKPVRLEDRTAPLPLRFDNGHGGQGGTVGFTAGV